MADCKECGKTFKHRSNLSRHMKQVHGTGQMYKCPTCEKEFLRKDILDKHMNIHKTNQSSDQEEDEDHDCQEFFEEASLKGSLKTATIKAGREKDPMIFLNKNLEKLEKRLKKEIEKGSVKWYLSIQVQFKKDKNDRLETVEPHFRGKCQMAIKPEDIADGFQESVKKIHTSFTEYQRQGSNWVLDHVMNISLKMAKYQPLKGSSFIPLPINLRTKHAIVNVQNRDKKCFLWSVLAAVYPEKTHPERVAKYLEYENTLDMTGLTYPVKVSDIPKFERQNKISVNVFGYEKGEIIPIHITTERFEQHVNLLMLSDGKKHHYCCVRDLNRLLASTKSCKNKHFFCSYCLHGFTKESLLEDHIPYCQIHGPQKIELPTDQDKWLYYKDVAKQLKVPYVIYADFECYATKIDTCSPDPSQSYTQRLSHHVPSGFAYKVVGLDDKLSENPVVYCGDNVADIFIKHMLKEQERINMIYKNPRPLNMSADDWRDFNKATECHICHKSLGDDTVRDHCHITGKFRAAAHNDCNVNFRLRNRIPVIFHNLRGYDAHLIMQAIGKVDKNINCIPNNMEKYVSFSMGTMDFIDSFQFLPTSLEKLVGNLKEADFRQLTKEFPSDKLSLLLRKGIYPYDYVDCPMKLNDTQLPPPSAFQNSLTEETISAKDYDHAQKVWDTFGFKTLREYHDLYMLSDVLQLSDVFENFRDICMNYYELDPAHFYTSPGLAWQACLKMTAQRLELFTDLDMHLFIEKGLRGGISTITNRYARANNPYLPDFDPSKPSTYIAYMDANNLYGYAMSQALPTHDFRWIEPIDVTMVPDDAKEGYILEVDLAYPENLHDLHSDYPLAPESIVIDSSMLSPYCQDIHTGGASVAKLVPNLLPKTRYVVHYRNLKQYLSLGMVLTKIHRVMAFQQSPWMKSYIDFNTDKRKEAENDFEKDFFKLMNNSVFGKTMENLRKRIDVKLVNSEKRVRKLTCKPTFYAFKMFNEDLAGIHLRKAKLKLNRPIYVGFSILDISKTLMYDFHYSYIKTKYGMKAKLLFTDTDSLCYEIETADIYKDMHADAQHFDTSDYPMDHPLYNLVNKKVLGKMKDECAGVPPSEFVGLRSKMYSLLYNGQEKKTAKGIKKSVVKNSIKHEDYKTTLFGKISQIHTMVQIRSFGHELYTVKLKKTSLSPYDDKRYILENGCDTLAYGHYKTYK